MDYSILGPGSWELSQGELSQGSGGPDTIRVDFKPLKQITHQMKASNLYISLLLTNNGFEKILPFSLLHFKFKFLVYRFIKKHL